jgi:hypothetical protein
MKYLTPKEHELVMGIVMDYLLELKAENDSQEWDDIIDEIETAMDKLDNLLVEYGEGENK